MLSPDHSAPCSNAYSRKLGHFSLAAFSRTSKPCLIRSFPRRNSLRSSSTQRSNDPLTPLARCAQYESAERRSNLAINTLANSWFFSICCQHPLTRHQDSYSIKMRSNKLFKILQFPFQVYTKIHSRFPLQFVLLLPLPLHIPLYQHSLLLLVHTPQSEVCPQSSPNAQDNQGDDLEHVDHDGICGHQDRVQSSDQR